MILSKLQEPTFNGIIYYVPSVMETLIVISSGSSLSATVKCACTKGSEYSAEIIFFRCLVVVLCFRNFEIVFQCVSSRSTERGQKKRNGIDKTVENIKNPNNIHPAPASSTASPCPTNHPQHPPHIYTGTAVYSAPLPDPTTPEKVFAVLCELFWLFWLVGA